MRRNNLTIAGSELMSTSLSALPAKFKFKQISNSGGAYFRPATAFSAGSRGG
jgi:hypothetical protein